MRFKIGDKVVFLPEPNAYFSKFSFYIFPLKNDVVYTVRGYDGHGSNGIYLEGITNIIAYGCELSYTAEYFRKVEDSYGQQVTEKIENEINTILNK